jgi:glycogen synthase
MLTTALPLLLCLICARTIREFWAYTINFMSFQSPHRRRILFATGPGDSVLAFHAWQNQKPYTGSIPTTFTAEILDFCRANASFAVLVSSNSRACTECWDSGQVSNVPKMKIHNGRGVYFHLSELLYTYRLLRIALSQKLSFAIIDSGTSHWFSFLIFRAFGIRVIVNLHNTLRPQKPKRGLLATVIFFLDRLFFRFALSGATAVSSDCSEQLQPLVANTCPIVQFRPNFELSEFLNISDVEELPTSLLFVGRVEANKGIFDVIEMFMRLRFAGIEGLRLEICGSGSSLNDITSLIKHHGLSDCISFRGQLNRYELLEAYEKSSIVLIPTRSTFSEGFAMVCAEANLCGRPVIASSVVPAVRHLPGGALVFEADNIAALESAALELLKNPKKFSALAHSARDVAFDYFSKGYTLNMALEKVFKQVADPNQESAI